MDVRTAASAATSWHRIAPAVPGRVIADHAVIEMQSYTLQLPPPCDRCSQLRSVIYRSCQRHLHWQNQAPAVIVSSNSNAYYIMFAERSPSYELQHCDNPPDCLHRLFSVLRIFLTLIGFYFSFFFTNLYF